MPTVGRLRAPISKHRLALIRDCAPFIEDDIIILPRGVQLERPGMNKELTVLVVDILNALACGSWLCPWDDVDDPKGE